MSQKNPSVLCFRKFPVAKKFMDKRRSGVSRFSVEKGFASQYRTFRRGTFLCCVSENFWYRKWLGIREGAVVTIFCEICFVSQYRKTSYGKHSVLNKISIVEKFMDKKVGGGGEYHNFRSKIFCLAVPKSFTEEPVCTVFQKNSGREKVYG